MNGDADAVTRIGKHAGHADHADKAAVDFQLIAPAPPPPWSEPVVWNIPDVAPDDPGQSRPLAALAALASFHYLRAAVRRQRLLLLLLTVLGVALGGAYLWATPASPAATVTLMLGHDEKIDSSRATATDISLLSTRTVAERAAEALGLPPASADALKGSVEVVPTGSPDILQLTMKAPTEAEAVRRIGVFAQVYLEFRAKQVSVQSDQLIRGYNNRIKALQVQVRVVSARIQAIAASGETATDRLSDAVTERSQFNGQISRLQDQVQDEVLRQSCIVLTSRVVDPPAALPRPGHGHLVLVLGSGLIGGGALGFGLVVLQAIVSDRLRLRMEIASALKAPAFVSVRRLTPLPRVLRSLSFLPGLRGWNAARRREAHRFAVAAIRALPPSTGRRRLGVVCVGNVDEVRYGLVEAAATLRRAGEDVVLVDLTEAGCLRSAVRRALPAAERPEVLRPGTVPSLGKKPPSAKGSFPAKRRSDVNGTGTRTDHDTEPLTALPGVCLVLAELVPAVGVEHLAAWTDRAIVAVTAGRSSAELVRTTGDLVRVAGLELHSGVLVRAEADDTSSGVRP